MVKIFDGIKLGLHLRLHQQKLGEEQVLEMARRRFGYGRWDAPFWFIGPEEGIGPPGEDDAKKRAKVWRRLCRPEVCDCRKFHRLLGVTKWHRDLPQPPLQSTWKPLMLLLFTIKMQLEEEQEKAIMHGQGAQLSKALKSRLRSYQRDKWGSSNGDTCVIELSALPAKNLKEGIKQRLIFLNEDEIDELLQKRIAAIRERMKRYTPALIVMYGLRDEAHWKQIAGGAFSDGYIQGFRAGIRESDSAVFVLTPHPANTHGLTNAYWLELGTTLRAKYPTLIPTALNQINTH
jgi:hypothetical protein